MKRNLIELSSAETKIITGGGVLRKYGEAFGEIVGGLVLKVGFALVVRRIF